MSRPEAPVVAVKMVDGLVKEFRLHCSDCRWWVKGSWMGVCKWLPCGDNQQEVTTGEDDYCGQWTVPL